MSSKSQHINTENYEEYFLLYVDGELTPAEMEMVDAFVLLHPALQVELEVLMNTRLTEEPIEFGGKNLLMSGNMKAQDMEESLLCYIDDELSLQEKESVEERLLENEIAREQLAMLMKAKLDAADTVGYPNKQELYRHSSKVVGVRTWMARAAAVIIIAFATAMYFNSGGDDRSVAVTTPPAVSGQQQNLVPTTSEPTVNRDVVPLAAIAEEQKALVSHDHGAANISKQPPAVGSHIAVSLTSEQAVAYTPASVDVDPIKSRPTEEIDINPRKFATGDVTTPITASYNIQEPGSIVAVDDDTKSKGSLKGFLRKATRLIERNTGIGATTDDDRLLIGALAVNLK